MDDSCFSSFSTFQSYQDIGRVIMKDCVQCNSIYGQKNFCLSQELNPDPIDQQASTTHCHTKVSKVMSLVLRQLLRSMATP